MRLFIAICFPDPVKDCLEAGIQHLRKQGHRASWCRRENLHLTLEFLGELDGPEAAITAMDQVTAQPFLLEFAPSGRFRRREGDLLWLGIQPGTELLQLQRKLHLALEHQGISLESRPYRPHLTLARRLRDQGEASFPFPLPPLVFVTGISLMLSQRTQQGMHYTELYRKELGASHGT